MKYLVGLLICSSLLLSACDSETSNVIEPGIERGAYLVRGVGGCGHCHTPGGEASGEGIAELSGDIWPAGDFNISVPNLTPDNETGLGAWSENEIATAFMTGLRPDGTRLHTLMPWRFYSNFSDSDAKSIAAFLKSIPAITNPIPRNDVLVGIPEDVNFTIPVAPPADPSDKVAYGRYLVGAGHCLRCHTRDGNYENALGTGGVVFQGPDYVAVSANITPHPEDGIPYYTVEDFVHLFKTGLRPNGTHVAPIMGINFFKTMSDEDMEAIALYLKTLEPKATPLDE